MHLPYPGLPDAPDTPEGAKIIVSIKISHSESVKIDNKIIEDIDEDEDIYPGSESLDCSTSFDSETFETHYDIGFKLRVMCPKFCLKDLVKN